MKKTTFYEDQAKRYAYMNACDCLKFGYGKEYWNSCGLKGEDADNIWRQAKSDMAKGD